MDVDHQVLLLHMEVWLLSQEHVLKCVCDLREKIGIFLGQQNFAALAGEFSQKDFNAKVAYLLTL